MNVTDMMFTIEAMPENALTSEGSFFSSIILVSDSQLMQTWADST